MAEEVAAGAPLQEQACGENASAPDSGEGMSQAGSELKLEAVQVQVQPLWEKPHIPTLSNQVKWPWHTSFPGAPDPSAPEDGAPPPADTASAPPQLAQAASAGGAEGAPAEPQRLTFEQHMWDRFELVWQRRVEPSQQLMERVMAVLRSRVELERRYGEGLVNLAASASASVEPVPEGKASSVQSAVDAAMVNFRNRGEQSLELAEQIDQDIVSFLEAVIAQHKEVSQRILADARVLVRYCQEKKQAHDKLARKYGSRCAEAEAAALACFQGMSMKVMDRVKLAQKATALCKQARAMEHEYYTAIDQANRAQGVYDSQMALILASLQDLEEKRGKCVKDCLMKLAVYDTSWLRNLQYDLEALVKTAEDADGDKDVQNFMTQLEQAEQCKDQPHKTRGFRLTPQAFWLCGKHKEASAVHPSTSKAQQQLQQQQEQLQQQQMLEANGAVRRLIEEELYPPLHALLAEGAAPSVADAYREKLEQLRQNITEGRRRAGLCQVLRAEVLARETPAPSAAGEAPQQATQPRPDGEPWQQRMGAVDVDSARGLIVAPSTLDALAPLIRAALDACDEQGDTWCARDLMVLVSLIRAAGEPGGGSAGGTGTSSKQTTLISRVYNHALWNKVTFWEEALVLGIYEAHAAEAISRRVLPPGSQFAQPAMTSFLQRFVGYMMAFGISLDQARNSVLATLGKNAALLGTSSQAYKTALLKTYEDAACRAGAAGGHGGAGVAMGGALAGTIVDPTAVLAPAPVVDEDFEAIALGLAPSMSSNPGGAETSSNPGGGESGEDEDDVPADDDISDAALKELAEAQPSVGDVFT